MDPWITADLLTKIAAALVLGGLIGMQREMAHKPAGLRTHMLIVLGAAVVMDVSEFAAAASGADPTRIAANIIVGIGFIGAGTIMKEGPTVHGLTSAATIWVDGALGTTIGCGYWGAAIVLTLATMLILIGFARVEGLLKQRCFMRRYEIVATEGPGVLAGLRAAFADNHLPEETISLHRRDGRLTLDIAYCQSRKRHDALLESIRAVPEVTDVQSL